MFVDTHCHLDDPAFEEDLDAVIGRAREQGIAWILDPGTTVATSERAAALARQYDTVYAAVGIHPEDCADASAEDLDQIENLAQREKVLAIGEIGLDYHWDENPPKAQQKAIFARQLEMAGALGLPVIIHDRDAHGASVDLVKSSAFNPDAGGVFHCYSGSVETARILLDRGFYLGFDGPITFKNNKKSPEVVAFAPLDRLLIETDSPYMAPVPHRGKRNEPAFVADIAAKMAEIKNLPVEKIAEATTANAKRLFHLEEGRS
ncbi:TatD family hydrolase [Pseudoramibacter sp.]|jgi:TatD DNase family protein|uniref:TatD family hydrolase n=1 Tax=Pseudoramibacter sp. TaxID=2034862 RepID=UPI0025E94124|nr:TatD family hydrolase [Pseudoramibacter sp.]MCH4072187.1 TatD family hydrolase [Pseudoramibacter sp.]MCH4105957.1 TatD family hydrolase [Pseudoramibacter sp.]